LTSAPRSRPFAGALCGGFSLVGIADCVRKAARHLLERCPARFPILHTLPAVFRREGSNMDWTGPCDPCTLGCRSDTAGNLGERDLAIVECVDHPEQAVRVSRRDRDHAVSLAEDLLPVCNASAPKVR
jgi:hypothetical protein